MSDELVLDATTPTSLGNPDQGEALLTMLLAKIEAKSPQIAEAVRLAAIPFWFNAEVLRVLRASDDGLEEKIIERIATFSFVERRYLSPTPLASAPTGRLVLPIPFPPDTAEENEPEAEGETYWVYTREARQLLLAQWRQHPQEFVEAHQRVLDWLEEQIAQPPSRAAAALPATPTPARVSADVVLAGMSLQHQIRLSILYHTLAVDAEQGLALLEEMMDQAESQYRLAAAEQILAVANEQRDLLAPDGQFYLDYLAARLDQLHGRWTQAGKRLQQILAQGVADSSDLRARVRRDLGRSLCEQGQWVEAINLQQEALVAFESHENQHEIADTMSALGETHLRLALAMSGESDTPLEHPWWQRWLIPLLQSVTFLIRFPILIYLASELGVKPILQGLPGLARNLDWVVARLFVTAARWLQRADAAFALEQDENGQVRTQDNLGELYLALNMPHVAEATWLNLLMRYGARLDLYRQARIKLGLATALVKQGKVVAAQPLLTQTQAVFAQVGHRRLLAQTQTLLAQCATLQGQPEMAVEHYCQAMALWREAADQQADAVLQATSILHQQEELARRFVLSPQAQQAIQSASTQLNERHYLVRFSHPLLVNFQHVAASLLAVVFLLTLFNSVHIESGTRVEAITTFVQPALGALEDPAGPFLSRNRAANPANTGEPEVFGEALLIDAAVRSELTPQFDARIFGWLILAAFLGYGLFYTAIGLAIIRRTPLQSIQEGERATILVDEAGISQSHGPGAARKLNWSSIDQLIIADRFQVGDIGEPYSSTCLSGQDQDGRRTHLRIRATTNYYPRLQQLLVQRLQGQAALQRTGFALLGSLSGLLFLLSLLLLALFVLLVQFPAGKNWLLQPIFAGYALSDFYTLTYLSIAVILVWWFAVLPLRSNLLLVPNSPWLWAAGASGVLLALFALLRLLAEKAPSSRPDVVPTVLALMFLLPVATHLWRNRALAESLARVLRLALLTVALLLSMLLCWFVGRELVSFHFAVQGNHALLKNANEEALAFYTRSLALRLDPSVENSRGALLTRLNRSEEAIAAYQNALRLAPTQSLYHLNIGLAYEQQAVKSVDARERLSLYQSALSIYNAALAENSPPPPSSDSGVAVTPAISPTLDAPLDLEASRIRSYQAGVHYRLARTYSLLAERDTAQEHYHTAYQIYSDLIRNAPRPESAYFVGRGYANLYLSTPDLTQAIADFEQAVRLAPNDVAAYSGLAWANYYSIQGYDGCKQAAKGSLGAAEYARRINAAIASLTKATELQSDNGKYYRTRAQLRYLLRDCQEVLGQGASRLEIYRQAIADYDLALQQSPENAAWWYRQAMLHVALAVTLDRAQQKSEARQHYQTASAGFDVAIGLDPTDTSFWVAFAYSQERWHGDRRRAAQSLFSALSIAPEDSAAKLAVAERLQQERPKEVIARWLAEIALEEGPSDVSSAAALLNLAQVQLDRQQYAQALTTVRRARQADPTLLEAIGLEAQILFRSGDYTGSRASVRTLLTQKPGDAAAHLLLAEVEYALDNRGGALEAAQAALALVDHYEQALQLLAFTYQPGLDLLVAERAAHRAIELLTTKAEAEELCQWFLQHGDGAQSLAAARRGVELAPSPVAINSLLRLGWWAYLANNYPLSILASQQAIDFHQQEPRPYFNLGLVYVVLGQAEEVEKWYTAAIDVTNEQVNSAIRGQRLTEALEDLRAAPRDPAHLRERLIVRLEQAKE